MTSTRLASYYQTLDDGSIEEALAMLEENIRFVIALPSGPYRGESRADMGAYLSGRGAPDRRHVILREACDSDVEFVYGKVTEGGATTGYFLATARLGPDKLIGSYQVMFETGHVLLEGR